MDNEGYSLDKLLKESMMLAMDGADPDDVGPLSENALHGENGGDGSGGDKEEKSVSRLKLEICEWMELLVKTIVVCVLIFTFIVRVIAVDGYSMEPTLQDKDKVIVSNLFYTPRQFDIIVLHSDYYKEQPLVKRIIATEGQTVKIDFEAGNVWVDGVLLDEPYISEDTHRQLDFPGELTVPEGHVFVMGDNRNKSNDSRDSNVGFVDVREIFGRVYFVVYPFSDFGFVD